MFRRGVKITLLCISMIAFTCYFNRSYDSVLTLQEVRLKIMKNSSVYKFHDENKSLLGHPNPEGCPKNLILQNLGGGLGNKMCQYATLLALVRNTGRYPVISKYDRMTFRHYFESPSIKGTIDIKLDPNCTLKYISYDVKNKLDSVSKFHNLLEELGDNNIEIVGNAYRLLLFLPIRDLLLKEFKIGYFHSKKADEVFHSVTNCHHRNCTYICVHVRRTDHAGFIKRKAKGNIVGAPYLYSAMKLMKFNFPDSVFLVISDDMFWCKRNLNFPEFHMEFVGTFGRYVPAVDLAILVKSNHSILTHGTFGFIGAFLSGGHVIQPIGFSEISPSPQIAGVKLKWTQIDAYGNFTNFKM